jgi:esterase/lipase superfamily enzyme
MKELTTWYSTRVERDVTLARWGHYGTPVLVFPTAGGDAEEIERFHLVDATGELLGAGRVKLYSCESVNGRVLLAGEGDGRHRTRMLIQFLDYIRREVVPAIRADCHAPDIEIVTAGSSIGAYNSLAVLCRSPEVFRAAVGMSGTYDLTRFLHGPVDDDFIASSPVHFLSRLDEDSPLLSQLRSRLVILATGQGAHEDAGESWKAAHELGARGVPNRVDLWGPEWPHDWQTWRAMLPHYLDSLC